MALERPASTTAPFHSIVPARPPACDPYAAPARIVSDIHGQYSDLMRLLAWTGELDGTQPWVFLGETRVGRTAVYTYL